MSYTDPTEMVSLVRTLTGFTDRDSLIQLSLDDSAGTDPNGVKTYRPYFVASFLIKTNRSDQSLTSAGDVKFQSSSGSPGETMNLPALIVGYMQQQQRLDSALSLTIPPGFAAVLDPGSFVMSILSS